MGKSLSILSLFDKLEFVEERYRGTAGLQDPAVSLCLLSTLWYYD